MLYDFCVIGGGIVGLVTAMELLKVRPGASLVLFEKEQKVAAHQTGHNSGVVHSGIYYAPGSLKARLCKAGADATKAFAAEHGIAFEECGKLIVATSRLEIERMEALHARGIENGLEIRRLSAAELNAAEPEAAGLGALFVPATGIVDYREISRAMVTEIRRMGGDIRMGERVRDIRESGNAVEIRTDRGTESALRLVACAGLQSDRLARIAGLNVDHRIVPFRGEYYALKSQLERFCVNRSRGFALSGLF